MTDINENVPSTEQTTPTEVAPVVSEPKVGDHVGQCKWWSDKLGYGFITVQSGELKGKDIFVHHSGIRPLNSNYKTLKKGEYINFDVTNGDNGMQAINVTGIGGGTLFCDVNPFVKTTVPRPQGFGHPTTFVSNPVFTPMPYDASNLSPRRMRPPPRSAPGALQSNIMAYTTKAPRPYRPRPVKQPSPPRQTST